MAIGRRQYVRWVRRWSATVVVALVAALVTAVPAPVSGMRARSPQAAPTPPECATLLSTVPSSYPSWVFVLNFHVVQGNSPQACLLVYPAQNMPPAATTVPCLVPNGGVKFEAGRARFDGGRVECSLDIRAIVSATTGIDLPAQASYGDFYIGGAGALDPVPANGLHDNAVLYYAPDAQAPAVGLFVPVTVPVTVPSPAPLRVRATQATAAARIVSLFNGIDFASPQPSFSAGPDLWQGWSATFERSMLPPQTVTITHFLEDQVLNTFVTQGVLNLRIDGGRFIIGDDLDPLSEAFTGTLCGVLATPLGGGTRPPKVRKPIACYDAFVPTVIR